MHADETFDENEEGDEGLESLAGLDRLDRTRLKKRRRTEAGGVLRSRRNITRRAHRRADKARAAARAEKHSALETGGGLSDRSEVDDGTVTYDCLHGGDGIVEGARGESCRDDGVGEEPGLLQEFGTELGAAGVDAGVG
jgi:hypothetical protein